MSRSKIDIAARTRHLDVMLQRQPELARAQHDERAQLVEDCRLNGDHVPDLHYARGQANPDQRAFYACQFCGLRLSVPLQQISRALVVG